MPKLARLVDDWSTVPDLDGLRRYVVYEPVTGKGPTAAFAWVDGAATEGWLEVDERPRWDRGGSTIHRLSFFRRLPSIGRDEFARHWTEHVPLAERHHPTLLRYVQNYVVSEGEFDGVAELGFAEADDMVHRVYDSEEGKRIIRADVAEFTDTSSATRVDGFERVLVG